MYMKNDVNFTTGILVRKDDRFLIEISGIYGYMQAPLVINADSQDKPCLGKDENKMVHVNCIDDEWQFMSFV